MAISIQTASANVTLLLSLFSTRFFIFLYVYVTLTSVATIPPICPALMCSDICVCTIFESIRNKNKYKIN